MTKYAMRVTVHCKDCTSLSWTARPMSRASGTMHDELPSQSAAVRPSWPDLWLWDWICQPCEMVQTYLERQGNVGRTIGTGAKSIGKSAIAGRLVPLTRL